MNINKATALAVFGTALEVYDFLIYSLLASYLTKIFFSYSDTNVSWIETFIVFSVGYVSRPIGGAIISSIGDRLGRKRSFLIAIQVMAVSTFLISVLPSFHSIGILSPILLMFLRVLQGLSHGAEIPSAITFVVEFSEDKKKGYYTGLIFFGTGLGGILSTAIIYIITKYVEDTEIVNFYWRIPFFIGGILSVIGIYFRQLAFETPSFNKLERKELHPFKTLISSHLLSVCRGVNIAILPILLIILGHYLPAYLKQFQKIKDNEIYFSMLCGMLIYTISVPIFAFLSDYYRRLRIIAMASILVFLLTLLLFLNPIINSAIIFIGVYKLISALLIACFPCILAGLFPTRVRNSGVALSYNIAFLVATFLLFLSTYLSRAYDTPTFTLGLVGLVSIYSVVFIKLNDFKECVNSD